MCKTVLNTTDPKSQFVIGEPTNTDFREHSKEMGPLSKLDYSLPTSNNDNELGLPMSFLSITVMKEGEALQLVQAVKDRFKDNKDIQYHYRICLKYFKWSSYFGFRSLFL